MAANTGRCVSRQHVLLLVLLKACLLGGRVLGASSSSSSSSSSSFFSTESPENPDYVEYHDYEDSPHCEPLEGEECQGLGYDTTLFPNLLNHRSQDAALEELKELIPLIEVECSEVLREFLCSLYMPVCTNYGFHLPPCRALCRQAREECEQAMLSDGLKWPDKFDCTRFPEHHELMCVLSLNQSNFLTTPIPTQAPPNFSHSWRSGASMYPAGPSLTQCVSNADCVFERSVCRAGECVCEYPRTWGPYGCEETQILGGQCTNDNQCSTVTPNAVCLDNKCACISPLTSYMNLACIHEFGGSSFSSARPREPSSDTLVAFTSFSPSSPKGKRSIFRSATSIYVSCLLVSCTVSMQ
ncbi:frizzled-1-like [Penaeus chinensis]|uniref:frizzled-1-like n=1 Tax=Penaeus chinensis TaxID=139456 RepID=UPI001FB628AE|nr:frizzled-1-like [Penaeus chinensis]